MSCGVGRRCGLDPQLLWLWCRLEATALIRPLAWEPPCATDVALKRQPPQKKFNIELPCHPTIILLSISSKELKTEEESILVRRNRVKLQAGKGE